MLLPSRQGKSIRKVAVTSLRSEIGCNHNGLEGSVKTGELSGNQYE